MGTQFADQYSLLHFAVGIVVYFWNVPFWIWTIIHSLFELLENSSYGVDFINSHLSSIWPGGKPAPDDLINQIGDTFFAMSGWLFAWWLDRLGEERGWYSRHRK